MKNMRLSLVAVLMLLMASAAQAVCNISNSSISFGNYDVFSGSADTASGTFTVRSCSSGKNSYTASISTGSGSYTARTMSNGTDDLEYNLYTSNSYTTVWGNGSGGSSTASGTGITGSSGGTPKTIYGRIPAGQDVSAGSYSDSLTITISF